MHADPSHRSDPSPWGSSRSGEERYQLILDTVREGILILDGDLRVLSANRSFYDDFEVTPEETEGRLVYDLGNGQWDIPALRELLEEIIPENEVFNDFLVEHDFEHVGPRTMLLNARRIDEHQRILLAIEDVTERRRTERALRESEEQLRQLAETVPDVVFTATPEGRIDYVNARLEEITGRPTGDILGTTMWPALVHDDDRARTEATWAEAVEGGERFEVRHRLLTDDGPCWVISRTRPVRSAEGEVTAWFGTVTDVDALARAEHEVRELNRTLEDRVEDRTRQVRRLSARLAAAEQDERRRIAHVLHDDLQQQLVGLGIMLGLLGTSPPEERPALRERAVEILDDAAALTRSLASELAPASLASEDLADTLRWLAEQKRTRHRMEIAVETDGPVPVPDPDIRALLYQALRELLFNVVKHAGTRQATVRARREGTDVIVEVEDEGTGFDPSETPPDEGGFGLFSVRERMELSGGRLDVASAPGQGTRVTLTAPADRPTGQRRDRERESGEGA